MDKGTQARTLVLFVTWLNVWLVQNGYQAVPVLSEETASLVLAMGASGIAWFYNNYITWKGRRQKEVIEKNGLN